MQRDLVNVLKALADETRLRIMAVLIQEPLSVNEVREILCLKQSRVSRHLKILERAGLLESHRAGTRIYYAVHAGIRESAELNALFQSIGLGFGYETARTSRLALEFMSERVFLMPDGMEDDHTRMADLLDSRKRDALDHFQRYGLDQDQLQQGLVDSRYYRERILEFLPEAPGRALDIGCGAGELASLLAGRVAALVCVDQSPNMLERARQAVDGPGVEFRIGSLEHLPLGDGEVQTVIASMVLHHIPEPAQALAEIRRVLAPGGSLVLAELDRHEEEVMRTRFADFWLGFSPRRLERSLAEAGFEVEGFESGKGAGELQCLFYRAQAVSPERAGELVVAAADREETTEGAGRKIVRKKPSAKTRSKSPVGA